MQDVMIFGEGHEGALREIEEGKDYILVTSKPVPSNRGPSDMIEWEARGGLKFDVLPIEQGGQTYLIGVRDDPPTIHEIDRAIKRYRPKPIR